MKWEILKIEIRLFAIKFLKQLPQNLKKKKKCELETN